MEKNTFEGTISKAYIKKEILKNNIVLSRHSLYIVYLVYLIFKIYYNYYDFCRNYYKFIKTYSDKF